jgi:hypothetical protein
MNIYDVYKGIFKNNKNVPVEEPENPHRIKGQVPVFLSHILYQNWSLFLDLY